MSEQNTLSVIEAQNRELARLRQYMEDLARELEKTDPVLAKWVRLNAATNANL